MATEEEDVPYIKIPFPQFIFEIKSKNLFWFAKIKKVDLINPEKEINVEFKILQICKIS